MPKVQAKMRSAKKTRAVVFKEFVARETAMEHKIDLIRSGVPARVIKQAAPG